MTRTIDSTPKADGFRMPAEWEPHKQTWMLWPQRPDNWRLGAKPIQRVLADVAAQIARFEPVVMGVNHEQFENARALLAPEVRVVEISSDDCWMRDCGPAFVRNDHGEVRLVDFGFNAWGGLHDGLYFPWDKDDLVPRKVAELEGLDRYRAPLVLEGGSFLVDGQGTLLTTEECLLSPGRNPQLSKAEIERHLQDYLGVEKVVWLARGIDPEETNGHVDGICCFARPAEVIMPWVEDPSDYRYEIQRQNYELLCAATDARGRRFTIHKLPEPGGDVLTEEEAWGVDAAELSKPRLAGAELPFTHINLYLCNGAVVMDTFDDANDEVAAATLRRIFPDRTVLTIPGREIALGGGGIHCLTQQQPAAARESA